MTDAVRPKNSLVAALLFAVLFVVYHANVTVLDEGDGVPSSTLPYAILGHHRLSFDPEDFPELFKWKSLPPLVQQEDFYFVNWRTVFGEKTARTHRADGTLSFNGPRYYVVDSSRHPGSYVSTFGPIPGIVLLPIAAPFYLYDPGIPYKPALRTSVSKLGSAAMVAWTAALLFLVAARFTTRRRALFVAAVYGLGTCAFAVSSQNLWQQTVNQFFLMAGAYFFLGDRDRISSVAWAGFFFGAATACRATGAVALAGALFYLFRNHRRSSLAFVLGALPVPLAMAAHNTYYFGSPLVFAQELVGHKIAIEKTGSPELFQTPFWLGALGLLVSPSRGLLVFSPLLGASFAGIARVFRREAFAPLRPLVASALATMVLQCKWFDWWGGWTYGYRPWLDAVPFLVLCLVPVLDDLLRTRARRAATGALFAWAVGVQVLGALTYDRSWNTRRIFVVRIPGEIKALSITTEPEAIRFAEEHGGRYLGPSLCDIDLTYCRHRLWSLDDNIIGYSFTHYDETRGRRLLPSWDQLGDPL